MPRDFGRRRMRKKRARACFCEEVVFEMEEEREVGERDGVGAEVEHAERGVGGGCGLERGDGLWGEAVAMEVEVAERGAGAEEGREQRHGRVGEEVGAEGEGAEGSARAEQPRGEAGEEGVIVDGRGVEVEREEGSGAQQESAGEALQRGRLGERVSPQVEVANGSVRREAGCERGELRGGEKVVAEIEARAGSGGGEEPADPQAASGDASAGPREVEAVQRAGGLRELFQEGSQLCSRDLHATQLQYRDRQQEGGLDEERERQRDGRGRGAHDPQLLQPGRSLEGPQEAQQTVFGEALRVRRGEHLLLVREERGRQIVQPPAAALQLPRAGRVVVVPSHGPHFSLSEQL